MHKTILLLATCFALLGVFPSSVVAGPPCGAGEATTTAADTVFFVHRPGSRDFNLTWRDWEFMWDPRLGALTQTAQNYLDVLATNLSEIKGKNPFNLDISDFHLTYDYFRLTNAPYTEDPTDTNSVFVTQGGFPDTTYNPSDRSHVDVYLLHPTRGGR